jgi:putative transposase
VCREHGISEQTLYGWKKKYGGMKASEAKRLRELEEENRKLKRIVADQAVDIVALKDVLGRKWSRASSARSTTKTASTDASTTDDRASTTKRVLVDGFRPRPHDDGTASDAEYSTCAHAKRRCSQRLARCPPSG